MCIRDRSIRLACLQVWWGFSWLLIHVDGPLHFAFYVGPRDQAQMLILMQQGLSHLLSLLIALRFVDVVVWVFLFVCLFYFKPRLILSWDCSHVKCAVLHFWSGVRHFSNTLCSNCSVFSADLVLPSFLSTPGCFILSSCPQSGPFSAREGSVHCFPKGPSVPVLSLSLRQHTPYKEPPQPDWLDLPVNTLGYSGVLWMPHWFLTLIPQALQGDELVSVLCSVLESPRTSFPLDMLLRLLLGGSGDFLFVSSALLCCCFICFMRAKELLWLVIFAELSSHTL